MADIPTCPECGNAATLKDSSIVYGSSYGPIWYCGCIEGGMYVSCKKGTGEPLGTLAGPELRDWRKRAHRAFDPLWQSEGMTRGEAYEWLASRMNVSLDDCHIGMFDKEQCEMVIRLARHRRGLLHVKSPKR